MKSIFKATAILGSSSVVSAAVGMISAKLWALMVGPAGIGYLATQQSLLGLVGMIAGFGASTGIVRLGAKAIGEGDRETAAATERAVIAISVAGGILGAAVLFLFSDAVNQTFLDGKSSGAEVTWIGIALIFTLLGTAFTGILNAHHNVRALAKIAIINSILSAMVLVTFVWRMGEAGIVPGLVVVALVTCLTSFLFYKYETEPRHVKISRAKLLENVKALLRFGLPYTGSMIVGAGVQLLLPILILQKLGLESVGFYRAAFSIAVTSLAVVMTAMAQDYYPRLSAASGDNREMVDIINQQLHLLFVFVSPIILWLLFLSPIVVPLLYSSRFSASAEILNWFLIGDIFRLLSWTLSFVILARSKEWVFFLIELFGGTTALIASLAGMHYFGVQGLGLSYLATYFLYYLLVLFLLRRRVGLKYTRGNKLLVLSTLFSALGISFSTALGYGTLRIVIGLIVCLTYSGVSLYFVVKNLLDDREQELPT